MAEPEQAELTSLTVQLLSAYFSNNSVPSNELAALIATTRDALAGKAEAEVPAAEEFRPAVSARRSTASRDHIVSMIDGKPYKTLKRHLSGHGLTPDQYRERYKLPSSYPMVAPGYSQHRREVAQRLGLGRKSAAPPGDEKTAEPSPAAEAPSDVTVDAQPAGEAITAPLVRKSRRKAATGKTAKASAGTEPAQADALSAPIETAPAVGPESAETTTPPAETPADDEAVKADSPKARRSRTSRAAQAAEGEATVAPAAKRGRPKGSGAPKQTSKGKSAVKASEGTKARQPRARRSGSAAPADVPAVGPTE